jgi:ribonucleotide monophosphatase NagD (HAD superfamily)
MIGDNPNADVQGGNNMKERDDRWKTVLVETGVYRG